MKDMMIRVDLAKAVFQIHGALRTGEVQFRKKLSRKQFPAFMARQGPCLIIFEACGGALLGAGDGGARPRSEIDRSKVRSPVRQALEK